MAPRWIASGRSSPALAIGQAIPIRLGSLALAAGAVVAAVAQVAYLGAVEKVFAVSEIAYFDTGSLATMVDAATRTDDYVENLGFLVMAAGLVMLAWPREAGDDATSGLRVANWALAIALTAAVMSSFTESVLAIPVLLVVGFAVAPAWILVAARKLDRSTPR